MLHGITISGRPVLNRSLAVCYAVSGTNAWSYHAFNLLIHALAGLTLFGVVRRTLQRPMPCRSLLAGDSSRASSLLQSNALPGAFTAALLWTLHPLQTEAVTYVIQKTESLMGLFFLLTFYCFIRAVESPRLRHWQMPAVRACLLGVGAKEVIATAPVLVFLYDRTFVAGSFREAWRRRRWLHLALATTWGPLLWRRPVWGFLGAWFFAILAPTSFVPGTIQTNQVAEAVKCFELALRMNPDQADTHFNLALALERIGWKERAIEQYAATVRIDPRHVGGPAQPGHRARPGRQAARGAGPPRTGRAARSQIPECALQSGPRPGRGRPGGQSGRFAPHLVSAVSARTLTFSVAFPWRQPPAVARLPRCVRRKLPQSFRPMHPPPGFPPAAPGSLFPTLLCMLLLPVTCGMARNYQNFDVAIYLPVGVVQRFENPDVLQSEWAAISSQLKVDKVYIEVQRDRVLASDQVLDQVKKFFQDRGVRVAGGLALSDNNSGQFRSFCYTNPADREFIQHAVELAARHFDEIILDDFFFVTTKYDSDLAAKGGRSWTQFRLDLMDEAAETLVIKAARAVNPRVKLVIKFPNWYEHFQGLGYDLAQEPRLFDGIYTGTETRDPYGTDQFLQQYESYEIFRYLENIKPGGNGGGWVDTFSINYLDRYAEQLWNTMFAKAPEIMLFNWGALLQPAVPGERAAWQALPTSFDYLRMARLEHPWTAGRPAPIMARAAGYSLEQVDAFLGRLGQPVGIESYKPLNSTGEDFLHNYLGMIGIPIDLHPAFPTDAATVLLTESAKFDPDIVARIKGQLEAGKSIIITSGLLRALQGRGIEDIVELECTDHKVLAQDYSTGFGSGNRITVGQETGGRGILFPQIRFLTNDAWSLVSARESGNGYPLLIMDRYAKGVLYVWTIPDNFRNLYFLPPEVTSAIKNVVMHGFFVRLDGPSQVALFAYDNHAFIVESYLDHEVDVKVSVSDGFTKLHNLVTGEELAGQEPPANPWLRHPAEQESRVGFYLHLMPHSYSVFAAEK
jgi:hypothetical protein